MTRRINARAYTNTGRALLKRFREPVRVRL